MRTILLTVGLLLSLAMVVALPARAPAASLRFFHSPSRNIDCLIESDYARCDIRAFSWKPPPKPKSCDLDFGSVLTIAKASRRGSFGCVGDTVRDPHSRPLAYGRSIAVGGMRCTSHIRGMRCANRGGHGFLLSRAKYRLF